MLPLFSCFCQVTHGGKVQVTKSTPQKQNNTLEISQQMTIRSRPPLKHSFQSILIMSLCEAGGPVHMCVGTSGDQRYQISLELNFVTGSCELSGLGSGN